MGNPLTLAAMAANVQTLSIVRLIVIAAIVIAMFLANAAHIAIANIPLAYTLLGWLSITLVNRWRLQQTWPVTEQEFLLHIMIDVLAISLLLYFSGGATNPFVSYFLVPLTIASATLPWRYTWLVAVTCLTGYSLLLFYYVPLPSYSPSHHDAGPNSHILGMWANFFLSSLLITYFVVKMANSLRRQEHQLSVLREEDLRSQQIMAVATLAAGTAHELGTPLNTMDVLIDELKNDADPLDPMYQDLDILDQQLRSCRSILNRLVNTAEINPSIQARPIAVSLFIDKLTERWQVLRPQVSFNLRISDDQSEPNLPADPALEQALINLLNNAADACPDNIDITLSWSSTRCTLLIRDHGPGISMELAEKLGKPFITTKGKGMGLGLFLSHAILNRHKGTVRLYPADGGGTITEVMIPLPENERINDTP
ncbi:MAG: ATP-binding protein [Pseudomonadales bacterium]